MADEQRNTVAEQWTQTLNDRPEMADASTSMDISNITDHSDRSIGTILCGSSDAGTPLPALPGLRVEKRKMSMFASVEHRKRLLQRFASVKEIAAATALLEADTETSIQQQNAIQKYADDSIALPSYRRKPTDAPTDISLGPSSQASTPRTKLKYYSADRNRTTLDVNQETMGIIGTNTHMTRQLSDTPPEMDRHNVSMESPVPPATAATVWCVLV